MRKASFRKIQYLWKPCKTRDLCSFVVFHLSSFSLLCPYSHIHLLCTSLCVSWSKWLLCIYPIIEIFLTWVHLHNNKPISLWVTLDTYLQNCIPITQSRICKLIYSFFFIKIFFFCTWFKHMAKRKTTKEKDFPMCLHLAL